MGVVILCCRKQQTAVREGTDPDHTIATVVPLSYLYVQRTGSCNHFEACGIYALSG
jgi:hypothetical protein